MANMRDQLLKAHARMKKWDNLKRSERKFGVGDWVYLKVQPYRQVTIQGKGHHHKLKSKFYGPFEMLAKVGTVAYELNLPPVSSIHPVFHVSQLKKKVGPVVTIHSQLPVQGSYGVLKVKPLAILDRCITKKKNQVMVEVMVQWANLSSEDATWEKYDDLVRQFPDYVLRTRLIQRER
jgi:Chromo (CHRromatin Organisation MOdifier) domain